MRMIALRQLMYPLHHLQQALQHLVLVQLHLLNQPLLNAMVIIQRNVDVLMSTRLTIKEQSASQRPARNAFDGMEQKTLASDQKTTQMVVLTTISVAIPTKTTHQVLGATQVTQVLITTGTSIVMYHIVFHHQQVVRI